MPPYWATQQCQVDSVTSRCRHTSANSCPVPRSLLPSASLMRKLVQRYRDLGTKVTYVPAKCDDTELITNTYRWTTDLFGMQTIDWIDAKLKKASS